MANITIKELLAADNISELVDKINFNFDQLLLNGGGPPGGPGDKGDIGPIGPRGTLWFTAVDLYTTSTSPSWTGTPERINDVLLPSYPQFGGDPNRYLPVGAGPNPQNTFDFGNVNKMLRDGDLYLQEGDDSFDGYDSRDGDIWEYDGFTFTWVFTGVNIKGDQGQVGSSGFQQWIRESNLTDDVLYPKDITGQDNPRILVGIADDIFNRAHPTAKSTFMSIGSPQLAIGHETLHGGGGGDNLLMPTFTAASDGSLIIQGSQNGASPQIVVQSTDAEIILSSGGSTFMTYSQEPDSVGTPTHSYTGGRFYIKAPDANAQHILENTTGRKITTSLGTSNYHTINSNALDIVFHDGNNRNIGIGTFAAAAVGSKLSVVGNVAIGNSYKSISAPNNGLIVQGLSGFGRSSVKPNNRIHSAGNISIDSGFLGWNTYNDGSYKRTVGGNAAFFKQESSYFELSVGNSNVSPDTVITPISAYVVDNSTGYLGFNTTTPDAKIHIYDEEFLLSNASSGNDFGIRIRMNGNVAEYGRDFGAAPADLYVHHFIGNAVGSGQITLKYDSTNTRRIVGIKSSNPVGDFEVRGDDNDVDSVHMGTYDDDFITGLAPNGTNNLQAGPYIGFNAYADSDNNQTVFKTQEGIAPSGPLASQTGTGVIIFMDRLGNLHIATHMSAVQTIGPIIH